MADIIFQTPEGGEQFSIAGGSYRVIIPGEQTGGSFAIIEMTVPPGAGPGPHAHPDFQESFYLLEGEVEIHSDAGRRTAPTGSFASIPKGGMIHSFRNVSDKPATLLCTVVPAGLENFFRDVEQLAKSAPGGKPDPAAMKQVSEKYGQTLYPPDYWEKHGSDQRAGS